MLGIHIRKSRRVVVNISLDQQLARMIETCALLLRGPLSNKSHLLCDESGLIVEVLYHNGQEEFYPCFLVSWLAFWNFPNTLPD